MQHGQISPDDPGYVDDCKEIAAMLAKGQPVFVVHSERMTAKALLLVPLYYVRDPGGRISMTMRRYVMVAYEGRGAYPFTGFVHPGYVMEKLGVENEVDASSIARFLTFVLAPPTYDEPFAPFALVAPPEMGRDLITELIDDKSDGSPEWQEIERSLRDEQRSTE